ncbi:hypothetical protein HDV06_000385 [Boothiomyces sp. JEL0866]|nr:hypothetical protein HDV06_000385 [Boothiomyces sp. JEL0866]
MVCLTAVVSGLNISQAMIENIYVDRVVDMLALTLVYIICLLNVSILKVFSVLDERITNLKANILTGFISMLYLVPFVSETAKLFYGVDYPRDNTQSLLLVYLVYRKKTKTNSASFVILKSLVTTLIWLSLFDWIGIAIFAYAIKVGQSPLYHYLIIIVQSYTGMHGILMLFAFEKLKDFTFVKRTTKYSRKRATKNSKNTRLADTIG